MTRTFMIATVLAAWVGACGGAAVDTAPPSTSSKVEEADQAIAIIRRSFDAMGGLPRLRLAGAKAAIDASVVAEGRTFPVKIALGGPEHYRIDYVNQQISFVHADGVCRKVVYGVSAHCTPAESAWLTPIRVLTALTFPAGDAANLRSNFRMREDVTINGRVCSVPEVRPKNTNLKVRTAYDKSSGLLAQASFTLKDAGGAKHSWQVDFGDWRPVKKMQVPFRRIVSYQGREIWNETLQQVDFDAYDSRKFDAPLPPTTDTPQPAQLPQRRIARDEVDGQAVEVPAPSITVGGGGLISGTIDNLPPIEVIQIVHRGPVADVSTLFERLRGGVLAAGRLAEGAPRVILLERPPAPGEPALMIIYQPLAPQDAGVKIEGI